MTRLRAIIFIVPIFFATTASKASFSLKGDIENSIEEETNNSTGMLSFLFSEKDLSDEMETDSTQSIEEPTPPSSIKTPLKKQKKKKPNFWVKKGNGKIKGLYIKDFRNRY